MVLRTKVCGTPAPLLMQADGTASVPACRWQEFMQQADVPDKFRWMRRHALLREIAERGDQHLRAGTRRRDTSLESQCSLQSNGSIADIFVPYIRNLSLFFFL